MIRYIELIEPFDQNGYTPNSVMASSPNGDWVLYSEAQAEIDALKAERDALLAAQEWRDIESAPKDGTDFLVDYEGVTIARWQPDGSPFPWILLDTDDGKFIFNRFRESVEGLVWRHKPLGWEAIAKARGDL